MAFFKQKRSSGEGSASNRSLHLCRTLTPYEKQEVEECSRIFVQLDKDEVFDEDMSNDVELPSFNVGLDFLWLYTKLPKRTSFSYMFSLAL